MYLLRFRAGTLGFLRLCSNSCGWPKRNELLPRHLGCAGTAIPASFQGYPANGTGLRRALCNWRTWNELVSSALASSTLSQTCRYGLIFVSWFAVRRPQSLCDPFRKRCDGTTPGRSGFGKASSKGCHQATVAIALLEEPFPLERFARDPVEKVRVNLWAYRLHEVASEAVTIRCVNVEHADTGVEAEDGSG